MQFSRLREDKKRRGLQSCNVVNRHFSKVKRVKEASSVECIGKKIAVHLMPAQRW